MEKSEKCPASSRLQPILLILCVSPLPQCRPFGRKEMEKTADRRTSTGQDQLCEACPKAFQQASDRLHSVAVGTAGCQRAYPVPVDVLRKTSAAGMQPACHFAKFQPVFHVPLLSYPFPDECSFRIILKGQQLTFVRTKQSSAEQRPVFRYCTVQPRRGRKLPGQGCAVCRKFISRPLERGGPMMVFRLPRVWGVILYCGLISFSSRSACPHLSII